MQLLHHSLLLACFASASIAQTYVVDAANGPGTNFMDIAAAVAAVPDGAKLEVRAGTYAPFAITGKGLSVFCASGVTLAGSQGVGVSGTSAAQTVVLRGLQINIGSILLANCQGPVVLEHCSFFYVGFNASLQLDVYDCAQVHVADSVLQGHPTVQATNSTVMLRGTSLRGMNCLIGTASTVDFVDCVQQQINPGSIVLGSPAMFLQSGSVRLVGGSVNVHYGPCIAGVGTARVDPSTTLSPGNGHPASTVAMTIAPMPAVVATDGPLGGIVTTTMRGPLGDFGALLAGLPGAPRSYPGIFDPIWLQPGTDAVCALTVFAAGSPLQVSYAVPNTPAMRGVRFCWQGISYGTTNGLQASNPALTTHW